MNKKYIVRLSMEERQQLEDLVTKGKAQAYRIKHAHILLAVDADGPNWFDAQAAQAFRCDANTVRNVRQRFVEQGVEAALRRKPQDRPSRTPILDGEKEARLIALACSKPEAGRAKWSLRLLADKAVELEIVDAICHETVRQALKKTNFGRINAPVG